MLPANCYVELQFKSCVISDTDQFGSSRLDIVQPLIILRPHLDNQRCAVTDVCQRFKNRRKIDLPLSNNQVSKLALTCFRNSQCIF